MSPKECPCQTLTELYRPGAPKRLSKPVGVKESQQDFLGNLELCGLLGEKEIILLDACSLLSLVVYDIEALTIPMGQEQPKHSGFCSPEQIGMLSEHGMYGVQIPFAIGYGPIINMETILLVGKSTLKIDLVNEHKKRNKIRVLQRLIRTTTPATRQAFASELLRQHTTRHQPSDLQAEVVEITRVISPADQVTQKDIQKMVGTFVLRVKKLALFMRLIKELILSDLSKTITKLGRLPNNMKSFGLERLLLKGHRRLTSETFLLGFNSSRYDTPAILEYLYTYAIKKKVKITAFSRGTTISSVNMEWRVPGTKGSKLLITMRDVRNLVEPTISLGNLGKRYGVSGCEESKGLFPHSSNTSIHKLRASTELPSVDSPEWDNLLGGRPNDTEIQVAHADFQRHGYANRYEYLLGYLKVCKEKKKKIEQKKSKSFDSFVLFRKM